jgi:hypothetical protein
MTLDEIYTTIADVSNSLYNLRKENKISNPDYNCLKKMVESLYSLIGTVILYPEAEEK